MMVIVLFNNAESGMFPFQAKIKGKLDWQSINGLQLAQAPPVGDVWGEDSKINCLHFLHPNLLPLKKEK